MEVRYAPNDESYQRLTTRELRSAFLIDNLFVPGVVTMLYSDVDRVIVGSAVPTAASLKIEASKKEMAAEFFLERREIGILNIGKKGKIRADGTEYKMEFRDLLYVGKGTKVIECLSDDSAKPALFYFASFPSHSGYPTTHVRFDDAAKTSLGSSQTANARTIRKYIHCLLYTSPSPRDS